MLRFTKNPRTGEYEYARWIPDYFGPGRTGVRFSDGIIYSPDHYRLKVKVFTFLVQSPLTAPTTTR